MSSIVEVTESAITVLVPIEIRRRNGRPRVVLPEQDVTEQGNPVYRANEAVVRAIARAWDWRRSLEAKDVTTLQDIADREVVTSPFVSRRIRLAYLSPEVLDLIVTERAPVTLSLTSLEAMAHEPWVEQKQNALDNHGTSPRRDVPNVA